MSRHRTTIEKGREAARKIDQGRAHRSRQWHEEGGESVLKQLFAEGKFPGYVPGEFLTSYLLEFDTDELKANFDDPSSLLNFAFYFDYDISEEEQAEIMGREVSDGQNETTDKIAGCLTE